MPFEVLTFESSEAATGWVEGANDVLVGRRGEGAARSEGRTVFCFVSFFTLLINTNSQKVQLNGRYQFTQGAIPTLMAFVAFMAFMAFMALCWPHDFRGLHGFHGLYLRRSRPRPSTAQSAFGIRAVDDRAVDDRSVDERASSAAIFILANSFASAFA